MAGYSFTLPTWIIVNNILMTRILNKLKKHFITLDLPKLLYILDTFRGF